MMQTYDIITKILSDAQSFKLFGITTASLNSTLTAEAASNILQAISYCDHNKTVAVSEDSINDSMYSSAAECARTQAIFSILSVVATRNDINSIAFKKCISVLNVLNAVKSDNIDANCVLMSIDSMTDVDKQSAEYCILKEIAMYQKTVPAEYVDSKVDIVPKFNIQSLKHSNVYRKHYYRYMNAKTKQEKNAILDEIIKIMACEIVKYQLAHPDIKISK